MVIADNLDRIDPISRADGRSQSEYLFVDRGEQLKRLNCHVVYTIPLALIFSDELPRLSNRFGTAPKLLAMVPVAARTGEPFAKGRQLLQKDGDGAGFSDAKWRAIAGSKSNRYLTRLRR